MVDRTLTPLALAVLDLLHEHDMHPYEMHQTMLSRQTDQRMKLRPGSLYHTVARLLSLELIEARETTRAGRRPERTVYGLTEAGSAAFTNRVRELLSRVPQEYPEFPVVLSMMHNLEREDAIEHLSRRIVQLEARSAALAVVVEHLAKRDLPDLYWIDARYAQAMFAAESSWTSTFLDDLKAGRYAWPNREAGHGRTEPEPAEKDAS